MIRLPYTGTYSLELITAQNGAQVVVCYSDKTATAYTGGTQATAITSATTTTICATPAAATIRDIDEINIKNTYSGSHTVTVQLNANGTNYPLLVAALLTDESLNYTHGSGWQAKDASGNTKTTPLTAMTSAQLAAIVSDETGTGALVFANSPTLVTPALGTPSSGTLTNCTGLPIAGGGTGQATAQDAINALTAVSAATNEYVLTKDTATGNAIFKAAVYTAYGLFVKADPASVAFTKTGAGTVSIKAGTKVDVAGTLVQFTSDTAITMPTLTAGTDYAIWLKDDATIQASSSHTSAPGAGNWRKIGGFHYAPGGNAAAQAGGDTTPAINAYSLWDLKFRPACPDPRGMTLVADSFWADIYLLGVDHLTNGTSKYNVTIADGGSPPKIPTKFGGNGSTAYSSLNWWRANEVLQSWGKRSPTYDEFAALAYGTTEATSSGGSDVPTTGVSGTDATNAWNKFTSRWGVIQATGCTWVWGAEFGGGAAEASWTANTGGRGSTYQMENAVLFGGNWIDAGISGSRASHWYNSPTTSYNGIGARGVCDHLILD